MDDAVEHARVLAHEHRQRVGQLMLQLDVREFLRKHLGRDFPPQPPGGQHVGLVARPHCRGALGACSRAETVLAHLVGERGGHARRPLDLGPRVPPRVARVVGLFDLVAEIRAAAVLAQDDEVGALRDRLLQWGQRDQGPRVEGAGADVGEGVEVASQAEEAGLGVWIGCAPGWIVSVSIDS